MEPNESLEEWRAVGGFEGLYEVSNLGRVRSLPRNITNASGQRCPVKGVILKGALRYGYRYVHLSRENKVRVLRVARLVASAFCGSPRPGDQAAHLDGSRANDAAANLKWASAVENASHKRGHGTHVCGENHYAAKLILAQVREIRKRAASGEGSTSICRDYPVTLNAIREIIHRSTWSHV